MNICVKQAWLRRLDAECAPDPAINRVRTHRVGYRMDRREAERPAF